MWIITKDYLDEGKSSSRVGVKSRDYDPEKWMAQEKPHVTWRTIDDDGEIIYEGQMTAKLLDSHRALDPLDWATADAGCTSMEYFDNETGNWIQI